MFVNIKDTLTTTAFRRLLLIQILSSIVAFAGTVIDGIIISRYLGEVKMAAYGLTNPIMIIWVASSFILASGSAAVCGQYMGRGETEKVNRILNKVILLATCIAAFFILVLFFFPETVAKLLGATGEVIPACADYIKTLSFSAFGAIFTPILIIYMQMDRDGNRALASAITFVIASTALDFLNVLVLKWDMLGMGLTTSVSYLISTSVLFMHFAKKDRSLSLSVKQFSFKGSTKIIKSGLPSATYHISNFVRAFGGNLIILSVAGTTGMFTNTVLNSIKPIVMSTITGVGSTALLLCSVLVGEGNRRSLHYTLKYIIRLSILIGLAISAVIFISSDLFLSNFFCVGDSAANKELVVDMFRLYSISIIFTLLNSVAINYLQSMKHIALSNIICVLDNAVFTILTMLILSGVLGINGIWLSYIAAELLALLFIWIYAWIKNKKIPTCIHDMMMLPEDFGVEKERRMNYTITSKQQLSEIISAILEFCEKMGVDEHRSVAAANCMEELAALALENSTGKPYTYVDIYLTFSNDELKLRMRDNNKPIDVSWLNTDKNPEKPEENLGIKIVYGMAKSVNYSVVLGMNVFSIVL